MVMKGAYTMYSALDISKYIVSKCTHENCPVSNLQLQKILYYIQRAFLRQDRIAFSDEIEAWQFGPVVPNVYYKFCGFGAMPITSVFENILIMANDLSMINKIVEDKRSLDPWDLVADTHKPNGAWNQIFQNGIGNRNIIPRELIKKEG